MYVVVRKKKRGKEKETEREKKNKREKGCKRSWREASSKPSFFFGFFLGRLGVSFDHICILVMKFAPGPVISVYLTDSHSLRTGALIGRFKSGPRCCCCCCILLTDNISDISSLPPSLFSPLLSSRLVLQPQRNITIFSQIYVYIKSFYLFLFFIFSSLTILLR